MYIKFPPCGRMNNDLPVIQIVAIHLQPIGDSVLVPIKRTQVRVSGWTVVLRRHPPVGDIGVYSVGRSIPRFFDLTLLVTALREPRRKSGSACVRPRNEHNYTRRIDVYVVISVGRPLNRQPWLICSHSPSGSCSFVANNVTRGED